MTRVLILGADGMLGNMVARVLAGDESIDVVGSTREGGNNSLAFDPTRATVSELLERTRCDWVVNAIGVLAPRIDESDPASVAEAIAVNAAFPNRLAAAAGAGIRVIQIATDGVFAGLDAPYDERAPHDAPDVYGRSKSMGEARASNVLNLRCSIIGPERPPPRSLLGWALSQPPEAEITGYSNHRWNGITSLHFARLCAAVIDGVADLPGTVHVVPADSVSKLELLRLCLEAFGRDDVTVEPALADAAVDRTLSSVHPGVNGRLWAAAGYAGPPTIAGMVGELASSGL